ncbi:MAG: SRPBCC domain-containing protein [Rhodobiaceae bacterium]|nr:SRPBCC domain-containing protein [Rhodobiaceae bacterium]
MTETTITKTIYIAASRETVWAYLTDKDKLGEWFHPAGDDLAVGEEYRLRRAGDDGIEKDMCWGKVLEMDRPARMVWAFSLKPLNGAMTTVTWTLKQLEGGTQLTMVHEGIGEALGSDAFGVLAMLDHGWDLHFASFRDAAKA